MDHLRKTLVALVLAPLIVFGQSTVAQDVDKSLMPAGDPFPATYADPAVPLIQLPTNFRTRRTTANITAEAGKRVEILNVKGAGCVRHLWFVFCEKDLDDLEI